MPDKNLVVIVGPTAIGKTAIAIKLAQYFDTEIVSADSRQFYKETGIGTAKPSKDELYAVKHHFINSHSIHDEFTVGHYETEALKVLTGIFQDHNVALLVGGSGLFVRAVIEGFDEFPEPDPLIREKLNQLFNDEGISPLQAKLKKLDPVYYQEVDINNPQRVIRALEVSLSIGQPFSSFRTRKKKSRPFNTIKIGLNTERNTLYDRINFRVDQMLASGLVEEARSLSEFQHLNALNTVGYSEIYDFLNGETSLEKAIDDIKQNTRRFAKRQLTWFRKDPEIKWFEPDQLDEIVKYISEKI